MKFTLIACFILFSVTKTFAQKMDENKLILILYTFKQNRLISETSFETAENEILGERIKETKAIFDRLTQLHFEELPKDVKERFSTKTGSNVIYTVVPVLNEHYKIAENYSSLVQSLYKKGILNEGAKNHLTSFLSTPTDETDALIMEGIFHLRFMKMIAEQVANK
ncbi:hypothetical protein [Rufibacter tibetensis]|uniref:Uncharacterized protein n=1 Tax=Rufibacter tibetensis TaxID=512763 RepID=A0A0P0CVI3_9BACT|nr:hypothetical protein [Rufibacter tibetensis]ALJ00717.1 hypothetical protein DC20_19215 [Rufibacter tibetensis]